MSASPGPALSSWSFHAPYYRGEFDLAGMPASARDAGFRLVELNDFMLPPPRLSRVRRPLLRLLGAAPAQWRYSGGNLARLRRALDDAGVGCLAWTVDSDLTVTGRWAWAAQRRYVATAGATAAALGAAILRLTLGADTAVDDTLLSRRLAQLVAAAPPALRLAVENHGGAAAGSRRLAGIINGARAMLPAGDRLRLGVCLDAGNSFGEEPEALWQRLLPLTIHVHVKIRTVTPAGDERDIDYPRFFSLLDAAGYRGPLSVEYEGDEPPAVGIRRSRVLLARCGWI